MESSFSSAFADIFLFYYEINFIKYRVNFSRKFLKNNSFSQLAGIKRICNNSNSLMLATHSFVDTTNSNGFPHN